MADLNSNRFSSVLPFMEDLDSNRSSSLLPANAFTLESDDISILVHTLLQSSTSASLDASPLPDHQQRPPPAEIRRQFCESAGFSDFSCAIASSTDGIGEFGCESEDRDASDVQRRSDLPRSSSKRTREAEIHNLSEKKRRQRINEKMKALQKLIPNSNKTDKASMLDEAIEYLKQLQLQVQMLALRNGSGLHLPLLHTRSYARSPAYCSRNLL